MLIFDILIFDIFLYFLIFFQHREVDAAHHGDGVERVEKLREDHLRESNLIFFLQIDWKLSQVNTVSHSVSELPDSRFPCCVI